MDRHTRQQITIILIGLAITVALLMLTRPAQAAEPVRASADGVRLQATPAPDGGVTPWPLGTPTVTPTGTSTPTPTPDPNPITQIFQHIINFDATGSLLEAWTAVLAKAQEKAVEDLEPVLEEAARQAAGSFLRFSSSGLEGLDDAGGESAMLTAVKDLWGRVFSVAVLLFPLSVMLNIAAVMISGVSAPVARAEMLEALARSLLVLGVSAGSFLLTGTMVKIAWGAAEVVSAQPATGDAAYLEQLFIDLVIGSINGSALESMLTIFITLTVIFLALMAISALILSYFAVLTLTVGLVVLSPLAIVVGSLPEFRWVYAAWLRAFVSVLLVPLANAILFKMWAVFALQGESLVDVLIGLGFLCLVITLNFYAGKLVFAPALEAGKLAVDSILAVVQLAIAAVGLAAGAAGLGAAGISAGNAGASAVGSMRGGLPGGPSGDPGSAAAVPGENGHGDSSAGFQGRVAHWKQKAPEERQAAAAGLEQQALRQQAAGQVAHSLAGRSPLLRAAAGVWAAGQAAGTAYERSAVRAADSQVAAEERAERSESGSSAPRPNGSRAARAPRPAAAQAGPSGAAVPGNPAAAGSSSGAHGAAQPAGSPAGFQGASSSSAPLPAGAAEIYPALFGNPAYDERTLAARGWNPAHQAHLRQNVQGLYASAQAAAAGSGLPNAGMLYDPLAMRPVQVEISRTPDRAGGGGQPAERLTVTPALFQAAAVRVSSPWLAQTDAAGGLPGARILERQAAEQVLRQVAADLNQEPVGRLAQEILAAGQADRGAWTPQEFWEQVNASIRRRP